MPETAARLDARPAAPAAEHVVSPRLFIAVLPPRATVRLQFAAHVPRRATAPVVHGVPLPREPNTWTGGDPLICWIAPDAWLLQSAVHQGDALTTATQVAFSDLACAVTDLSDAYVTLALQGDDAVALLARGCGLDFSARAFGAGACARTRFAQLPVLIRRTGSGRFEMVVDRSTTRYLLDWLLDAATVLESPSQEAHWKPPVTC